MGWIDHSENPKSRETCAGTTTAPQAFSEQSKSSLQVLMLSQVKTGTQRSRRASGLMKQRQRGGEGAGLIEMPVPPGAYLVGRFALCPYVDRSATAGG